MWNLFFKSSAPRQAPSPASPAGVAYKAQARGYDDRTRPTEGPQRRPPQDRHRPQTINVILFGETGVGKSAVVNLIAQRPIAKTSSDAESCTLTSTPYDVSFDGLSFRIFDTAGLNEPVLPSQLHQDAIVKAYELIRKLTAAGGIHLLLFCMRGGKISLTTRSNYKLFAEFFCRGRVPVGVVVTNCERERNMEDWWARNGAVMEGPSYGIRSDGHACVTAVTDGSPEEAFKYRASQQRVRELLKSCYLKRGAFLIDEGDWLATVAQGLRVKLKRRHAEKALARVGLRPENIKKVLDVMESGNSPNGAR